MSVHELRGKEISQRMSAEQLAQAAADEPLSVVPFPVLDPAALTGTAGKIVDAVMPYTEAHSAPVLLQLLAVFGAVVGRGPHVLAGNAQHPARLNPLVVGHTSDGAKGTSWYVADALIAAAERHRPGYLPVTRTSGLSSGEGLIEAARDASGKPDAKDYDEGVTDKRLIDLEEEFCGLLAVMERKGSIMARIVRGAWDGVTLQTLTRTPVKATDSHIIIVGHVTPGELRAKLAEAQLAGGTLNRFLPVASRRTQLLPDGGNLPEDVLDDLGAILAYSIDQCVSVRRVTRTDTADKLWHKRYAALKKARPDGPVAKTLARAVPQTLRLSLAYALIDGQKEIDEDHLHAAFALWEYAERTAEWMFGAQIDTGEVDDLYTYITKGGDVGRTRTQISVEHFARNKRANEIDAMLSGLISDGRVRQEVDRGKTGPPTTRYIAC